MTRVAAVDIGTNSARLLIADVDPAAGLRPIDRRLEIVRLGQGVDATGRLADEAIARTADAVRAYAAAWRAADVERVRITGTSAARDAANAAEFADAVAAAAGLRPEVLSGEEEARLAFLGATATLSGHPGPYAVLDIGGGSTEVVVGDHDVEASTSRRMGCVRLTERVLTADPPTMDQVDTARALVHAELDEVDAAVAPGRAATLIGVAGTVTTLAALHAELDGYVEGAVHGTSLAAAAVSELAERLLSTSAAAIGRLGPVQPGREDVLAAGALILDEFVGRFGFADVVVSEADVLDGLAMTLASP
ncbi:exopolyphosphatase [Euzebya sp.]|uniref:Ppx/GppA phosphatase family protein n=1 Tax=Euzebya sp. TaxID=1971409 RepID=UPI0035149C72